MLETLANTAESLRVRNAFLVKIEVPGEVWTSRLRVKLENLPPAWLAEPAGMASTAYGARWLNSKTSAILMVPSVLVPEEFNALINPAHPMSQKISAIVYRQFLFDPRLSS